MLYASIAQSDSAPESRDAIQERLCCWMGERSGGSLAVKWQISPASVADQAGRELARRSLTVNSEENHRLWGCRKRFYMYLCRLDNRAVRNRSVLDDNNNAVANHKAKILAITFLDVILIDHPDVAAYARVLIDDGSLDGRVCPDA